MSVPDFPDGASVGALVLGAGGSYQYHPGTIDPDGTFTIVEVPDGPYVLVTDLDWHREFVATTSSEVDLSRKLLGRPWQWDFLFRPFSLDVTGLDPWQLDDDLQVDCPSSGASPAILSETLAAGETGGNITVYSLADLDAALGDEAYVLQSRAVPIAGGTAKTVTRAALLEPFTLSPGTSVGAALSAAPLQAARLTIDQSAFMAIGPFLGPNTHVGEVSARVVARPFASTATATFGTAALVRLQGDGLGQLDIDVSFVNPFPAAWPVDRSTSLSSSAWLVTPGTSWADGAKIWVSTHQTELLADALATPIVTPVRNLRINGQDAAVPRNVSADPLLSWDPPPEGTATGYRVDCIAVFSLPGRGTAWSWVSRLTTTETEVKFPWTPSPGDFVAFMVTALATPGIDLAITPFERGLPFAYSQSISAVMTAD